MQMFLIVAASLISSILMPLFFLPAEVNIPEEALVLTIVQPTTSKEKSILLLDGQTVRKLPVEEYLVGVVAAEMPASFEMEALKAQAVAARTFTMRHTADRKHPGAHICSDSSCCQAWYDKTEIQQKLGDNWKYYLEKIERAVKETENQVVAYQGELIDAVYFSCSGGSTEDAVAVWGTDIPYLKAVESAGEEGCKNYSSTETISADSFASAIQAKYADVNLSASPETWIGPVVYSDGGGVMKIEIGSHNFTGSEIRELFHLKSAKFKIAANADQITFEVSGAGHRVGMSQYGANAMAEEGCTYKEILNHYYTGAQVITKNP